MINIKHKEMVAALMKKGEDIDTDPKKLDLSHCALGVANEAGEIAGVIKSHTAHNKELDLEHLTEEMGDMEFYLQSIRKATGITREDCLRHNMEKLAKRYEDYQYSDRGAQDRADKIRS